MPRESAATPDAPPPGAARSAHAAPPTANVAPASIPIPTVSAIRTVGPDDPAAETDEASSNYWGRLPSTRNITSWSTSAILHAALVILLALLTQVVPDSVAPRWLTLTTDGEEPQDAVALEQIQIPTPVEPSVVAFSAPTALDRTSLPDALSPQQGTTDSSTREHPQVGVEFAEQADLMTVVDTRYGGGIEGRSAAARPVLVARFGGTPESEAAVLRGLRWLQAHQHRSGAWHFNHHDGPCPAACRNPGSAPTTTGSTAIALLAYLGAGQTHQEGEFQEVVNRGLYYLTNRMVTTSHGGDLQEGTMYAQGLATIALCEAYAMTQDPALRDYARPAVDFVVYAQDKSGGGWRYSPGQPGDTTVTGWQVMALKSGQMAYLRVPPDVFDRVGHYLDGVAAERGAFYGYQTSNHDDTNTAVGLLCRMYLGWQRYNAALERGVYHLRKVGPSKTNMYYNYYATQVMHHWGGEPWQRWNLQMRDYLIDTQADEGHESGSWYFEDRHGKSGGRLYNTAMAIMTLEVYYRHLPIYTDAAVDLNLAQP